MRPYLQLSSAVVVQRSGASLRIATYLVKELADVVDLAVDEEPEVVVGVVLLELLHGDLLGLGHFGDMCFLKRIYKCDGEGERLKLRRRKKGSDGRGAQNRES